MYFAGYHKQILHNAMYSTESYKHVTSFDKPKEIKYVQ
jgi:hypothetical protein